MFVVDARASATPSVFYQHEKYWWSGGCLLKIEIWIFLGSFRAGSNLGHAGILFARVCSDGRADGQ